MRGPARRRKPGQRELKQAIGHAADHLSLYQLTIEEGTPFHALHAAGKLGCRMTTIAADLYALTQEVTDAHGLPAYEISNHARPGAESRHNLTYWRYGEYVGVGPGAHGRFVEDGSADRHHRREDAGDLADGLVEARGHGSHRRRDADAIRRGRRIPADGPAPAEGIDLARYEDLAGRPLPAERLAMLEAEELVAVSADGRIRATGSGALVLNALVAELAREPA